MRDGFGRKLSEEEVAKITGKPARTDAQDRAAKPAARPDKAGPVSARPAALRGGSDASQGNGQGPGREIIDEP